MSRFLNDEQFIRFSFVANLSEWAGKEVKLSLVAQHKAMDAFGPRVAKWLEARLVGAAFDIAIGLPEIVIQNRAKSSLDEDVEFVFPNFDVEPGPSSEKTSTTVSSNPTLMGRSAPSNLAVSGMRTSGELLHLRANRVIAIIGETIW